MHYEELAQLAVLREVTREHSRGCNSSRDLLFAHLHVPKSEHRFNLIEEVAAAAFGHLADGEQSTLLVPASEDPANTSGNRRADDVIDPRSGDAREPSEVRLRADRGDDATAAYLLQNWMRRL